MSRLYLVILCNLSWIAKSSIQSVLEKCHNDARSAVGIADLSWSSSLARSAQRNADRCVGCHNDDGCSTESDYGGGENLSWGSRWPFSDADEDVWYERCMGWVKERDYWTYGTKSGTERCRSGKSCGHYTQIVWQETTRVGCGWKDDCCGSKSSCSGYRGQRTLVCHYTPQGNMRGDYPYPKNGKSGSGSNTGSGSGSSSSDSCIKVSGSSSLKGTYKNKGNYYKRSSGSTYYLYQVEDGGSMYWTISTSNGRATWSKGWCGPDVNDVKDCSGDWQDGSSLKFTSTSCSSGFEVSDTDTESLCVYYEDEDREFTLSNTDRVNDQVLYSYEDPDGMYFIHWTPLMESNTTDIDEVYGMWVINDDYTWSEVDAWCDEAQLTDCSEGKWYQDIYDEYGGMSTQYERMGVVQGKCITDEDKSGKASNVALIVVTVVLLVVFCVFAVYMWRTWSKRRKEIPKEMVFDIEEVEEIEEVEVEALVETENVTST